MQHVQSYQESWFVRVSEMCTSTLVMGGGGQRSETEKREKWVNNPWQHLYKIQKDETELLKLPEVPFHKVFPGKLQRFHFGNKK